MTAAFAIGVVLFAAAVVFAILYVFSVVIWKIQEDVLELRWLLFGKVPFRRRKILLSNIACVEPFRFRRHWKKPLEFFGRNWPAAGPRVVICLRSGWVRGVVFIPNDLRELLEAPTRSSPEREMKYQGTPDEPLRGTQVTSAATDRWVTAAKILIRDPSAAVQCPERADGVLAVRDVVATEDPTTMERYLVCGTCGAFNVVRMRVPAR
jgi:hypothetical protein